MVKKIKEKKILKSKKKSNFRKYMIMFFLLFVMSIATIGVYTYIEVYQKNITLVQKKETASSDVLMQKMKVMLEEEKLRLASLPPIIEKKIHKELNTTLPIKEVIQEEHNVTKEEVHVAVEPNGHDYSEARDYENSLKEVKELKDVKQVKKKPIEVIRKKYPQGTIPKLAIIIDDVSFPWQAKMMKEIPYKINPSFFPPTSGHPETVRMSHEFEFAMIHLPMEAKHYKRPEIDTLNVVDSKEVMSNRIKKIKKLFPHIVYYNNHTGGYFTSSYEAMDKLIEVMKSENLLFLDSKTAPNSKAPEIAKKYNMPLLTRDVFLDNSIDKDYIKEQLKKAVITAKRNGYAIAIGHPHKSTLEVLRDAKDILVGIELVYVKDL